MECKIRDKNISCCISVMFQFEMVVLKVLQEFGAGTSIHGFTFLVSPKSSSRTKIIWAIAIIVALSYASWEMRNSVISKYHCIFRALKYKPLIIILHTYVQIHLLKGVFSNYFWRLHCCPKFLFFELETSNFGYLLIF